MSDKLTTFIQKELDRRGWSAREFGRRMGISHSHAARIRNGEARPSVDLSHEIARVLETTPEDIMQRAGILPSEPPETASRKEADFLFTQLTNEEQDTVLTMMRALTRRKRGQTAGSGAETS